MKNECLTAFAFFALIGTIANSAEAQLIAPFDYTLTGAEITDLNFDFKDIEIILDVEVTDSPATLKVSFDREFFDSQINGEDDDFIIIADGDLVRYTELENNSKSRTIEFHLMSGTDQVEIFGTHLKGITSKSYQIKSEEPTIIILDQTDKVNELLAENKQLQKENKLLTEDNEELDSRIFELENLVSALEKHISNLNALVLEQVKVIYQWIFPI